MVVVLLRGEVVTASLKARDKEYTLPCRDGVKASRIQIEKRKE